MTNFWFYAGLLLITALAFILIPLLRHPHMRADANRTGMNVGVYRERMYELEAQHSAGILDAAQLEAGRAEAARDLLGDAQALQHVPRARLGRGIPLAVALATLPLAVVMYLQWGALDEIMLVREHRSEPIENITNVTSRLEALLAERPDSSEGWSLLGRAYMAQERVTEAARAFERAADLAGRPAQLLGQWAEALYFAGGRKWTPELQTLTDEALASNPDEVLSLRLAAMGAFQSQRYTEAITYWERLQATLPEEDPSRSAIADNVLRARELENSAFKDSAAR